MPEARFVKRTISPKHGIFPFGSVSNVYVYKLEFNVKLVLENAKRTVVSKAIAAPFGFKKQSSPAEVLSGSSKRLNSQVAVTNKGMLLIFLYPWICEISK